MIFKSNHGGLSIKLLIIISLAAVILIGGGIFAYLKFMTPSQSSASPQPQTNAQPPAPSRPANTPGPIFDLEPFIVNLLGDSGRRYLKATIKLELSSELLKDEITPKMPEIKDNILILLSSKSYDEIAEVSGKLRLRTEIISRLNNILTTGEVTKVFFTEFVIQ